MYNRIFVPVDESRASLKALAEACKLAQNTKAVIVMVHVVDMTQFSWGGTGYFQSNEIHQASKEAGSRVLAQAHEVLTQYSGVTAEEHILESVGEKVANLLANKAKEYNCDLIVMGTHGFSGVMHLLMGSIAEGVLRQADMPILLVRDRSDD